MSWMAITIALLGGIFLGILYFGGLWITARSLPNARHPGLLSIGSYLIRMLVTLAGFYFLMGGQIENLLASLIGFIAARQVVFKLVRYGEAGPAVSGGPPS